MATKKTTAGAKAPGPGMRKFALNPDSPLSLLSALCHGNDQYAVTDGEIELPAGQTWYQHLVKSGDLVER